MLRRLLLTCGVLFFSNRATVTTYTIVIAIVTVVFERECFAYLNPFLSAFR